VNPRLQDKLRGFRVADARMSGSAARTSEVLAAAARRFLLLLGGISGLVLVLASLLGLALGTPLPRAISLGFYLMGAFLLVAGFFMGNRGHARLRGEPGDEGLWGLGRKRGVRLATSEEHADATATTTILITLGFILIVFGVIADSRYGLY
jgi:hypothetical protein